MNRYEHLNTLDPNTLFTTSYIKEQSSVIKKKSHENHFSMGFLMLIFRSETILQAQLLLFQAPLPLLRHK